MTSDELGLLHQSIFLLLIFSINSALAQNLYQAIRHIDHHVFPNFHETRSPKFAVFDSRSIWTIASWVIAFEPPRSAKVGQSRLIVNTKVSAFQRHSKRGTLVRCPDSVGK